ncbi:hypothetical protein NCCP2716_05090 [Sporosarcina sp. NCCP-2716]|uniref:YrrS family protein n=1 Tax=Sporosarcina sp. NCCP-2716 TaxID=2943679 RepID=UPI00203D41EC|nr:DUF1510 family protein [Sporosarcina sp. NCCP-2716]GKV68011.1 hypothetical protein NCCP2716_05090 [Sporosarcina sp. NCCP-2716]
MSGQKPEFSRVRRKRQNSKANKMLNWMIAIVVLLIILVGVKIIGGGSSPDKEKAAVTDPKAEENTLLDDSADDKDKAEADTEQDGKDGADDKGESGKETSEGTVKDETEDEQQDAGEDTKQEGTVTYSASEDAVVDETMTNSSWKPIGTEQSGSHVSLYDGTSKDWQEKQQALAYATGLPENDLIFWKIKNGGSPQKSIGIVSTKDKSKKYRVYLEWVDGEGWKPVQMDVLNTLDFNY